MSGIAGIIRFDGAPVEPGQIEAMTSAMAHRGPDGIAHWTKGPVALGHCMLRTTPESLEETQPLANEDESLVLVMDGRVDNWEELRAELLKRGAVLRTRADAELVLRAFETWGRDCLAHIDGDFALVIWDARRCTAFCARDRMGGKPFHYHWDGKTLVVASEVQAILAMPWIRQELNEGMVADFLATEWHSRDETFWKGCVRLVAAHQMEIGAAGPKPSQYWKPDLTATLPYTREDEYVEHYRELFGDIVRRLSRSHCSLACEVSGGLDSSAIFAMAESLRRQSALPAPSVDGYTLDFYGDASADELEYSRAVGKHLAQEIREIPPTSMPLAWYREQAAKYKAFPGFPNGAMAFGLRAEARSRGSRVLLVGTGGDEWLGGSHTYYADELASGNWRQLTRLLKSDYDEGGFARTLWWLLRFGLAPLLPDNVKRLLLALRHDQHDVATSLAWLSPLLRNEIKARRTRSLQVAQKTTGWPSQRSKMLSLTAAYPIFAHELEDRLCAELGLELRRPFWNAKLVQFYFSCPEQLRRRGSTNKYLHRQAMAGLLPEQVLKRTTKAEFSTTYLGHLTEMKDILVSRIPANRDAWIDAHKMPELYEAALRGGPSSGWAKKRLWNLFGCDSLA